MNDRLALISTCKNPGINLLEKPVKNTNYKNSKRKGCGGSRAEVKKKGRLGGCCIEGARPDAAKARRTIPKVGESSGLHEIKKLDCPESQRLVLVMGGGDCKNKFGKRFRSEAAY